MRRDNGVAASCLTVFILFCSLLFTGCAAKFIHTDPVSRQEEVDVSAAFQDMLENHRNCGCCLDAEADVTMSVKHWLGDRSGTVSGFLQAMEPSHIKFISVNPLGQPLFILTTDGQSFQNVQVPKTKVYEGAVRSAAFEKYMPAWLEPEYSFYWFAGRLNPAGFTIDSITRDKEQEAYWIELQFAGKEYKDMLLFDPTRGVILRRVIFGRNNKPNLEIQYGDYQALISEHKINNQANGACQVPGSIRIVSHENNGQMDVKLHSFLSGAPLTSKDFMIDIPSGFVRLPVQ